MNKNENAGFPLSRTISRIFALSSYNLEALKGGRTRFLLTTALLLLLGLYSLYFRTLHVSEHFWLLGDQVRDWNWALRPFSELPRVGTPTSKGGYCLGPIFYWTLWFIRITLGRLCENLPHAGGIGLAAIHSIADSVLLLAILKRAIPIAASLAVALAFVSSPFEASLSAAIWNPGLSVSFVEFAAASFLMIPNSHWPLRTFLATTAAWLAVQCHTQSIFFTLSLLLYVLFEASILNGIRVALKNLLIIVAVIAVLQVPYLTEISKHADAPHEQLAIMRESFKLLFTEPSSLHPYSSFKALIDSMVSLFELHVSRVVAIMIIGIAVAGVLSNYRRISDISAVALGPILLAWLGYSFLLVGTPDSYWYINLMPAFVLLLVFGFFANFFVTVKKLAALLGIPLLLAVLALQPSRLAERAKLASYPYYGAVVSGAKAIVRNGQPVKAVIPPDFPHKTQPEYLVRWLGGRVEETTDLIAIIGADGTVTYQKPSR